MKKSGLWLTVASVLTMNSCGGANDVGVASAEDVDENRSEYQVFLNEVRRVIKGVFGETLSPLAPLDPDLSGYSEFVQPIDSSPLQGDEYEYIEGVVHHAGKQLFQHHIASLLENGGYSVGALLQDQLVEVIHEHYDLGVFEYRILHDNLVASDCDESRVDCNVAVNMHVLVRYPDERPSIDTQDGLLNFSLFMESVEFQMKTLDVANSRVAIRTIPDGAVVQLTGAEFQYHALSSVSLIAKAQSVSVETEFVLEDFPNALRVEGEYEGASDTVHFGFSETEENRVTLWEISNANSTLKAQVQSEDWQLQLQYRLWETGDMVLDVDGYQYRFGLKDSNIEPLGSLAMNWGLSLDVFNQNDSVLVIRGEGQKMNNDRYEVESLSITGELFQHKHQISASVNEQGISPWAINSGYDVSVSDNQGVLIDSDYGIVAALTITPEWDITAYYLAP